MRPAPQAGARPGDLVLFLLGMLMFTWRAQHEDSNVKLSLNLFKNRQVSNLYRLPLLESQVKRYVRLLRLLLQFGFNLKTVGSIVDVKRSP